jgi:hypothetical protein
VDRVAASPTKYRPSVRHRLEGVVEALAHHREIAGRGEGGDHRLQRGVCRGERVIAPLQDRVEVHHTAR